MDVDSVMSSDSPQYWIYAPGSYASHWPVYKQDEVMGIGWDDLDDLMQYGSRDQMRNKMLEIYHYDEDPMNRSKATWDFSREMKIGDIVYVKKGTRLIIGRGIVASDYRFEKDRTDFKNIRDVKWTHTIGQWHIDGLPQKTLTNTTTNKQRIQLLESMIADNSPQSIEHKYCIICWNDMEWKKPSPKQTEEIGGFVGDKKFGFEEWLNRSEWVLHGYQECSTDYHYAHLHGVLTKNNKYEGSALDILLCARSPENQWLAVGRISKAIVLDAAEAVWASERIIDNGWLQKMRSEVAAMEGDENALPPLGWDGKSGKYKEFWLANIKYRPNDIEVFNRYRLFTPASKHHGTPYNWDGIIPTVLAPAPGVEIPDDEDEGRIGNYSERTQFRRGSSGKEVTPRQSKVQNLLPRRLKAYMKKKSLGTVSTEVNRVDVTVNLKGKKTIFIEIKCVNSVTMAVRLAIGQLLEYAHYPSISAADKLVIITDQPLDNHDDEKYVAWLRQKYNINIHLMHFDPDIGWSENDYDDLLQV